jgi:hypothetical protein
LFFTWGEEVARSGLDAEAVEAYSTVARIQQADLGGTMSVSLDPPRTLNHRTWVCLPVTLYVLGLAAGRQDQDDVAETCYSSALGILSGLGRKCNEVLLADGAEAGHKRTHEEYMDNFHGVLNNGGGVYGRGVCLAPQVRQRILGGSAAGVHGQANATYFGACCHRVTVWRMEGCNGVARTRGPPPSGPLGLWGRWCLRRLVHKSPLLKQREYVDLLWMLYGVNSSRATVCRALAYMGLTWQV